MRRFAYIVSIGLIVGLAGISAVTDAEMFVFPEKGQTKDQQEFDQFTCYKWAKEQTGIDPNQQAGAPAPQAPQQGQAMRGAAGGAAVGAIGGNAGKGAAIGAAVGGGMGMMRHRRSEMEYQQEVQQQAANRQAGQQEFNRAYSVCLEGKGYKVG